MTVKGIYPSTTSTAALKYCKRFKTQQYYPVTVICTWQLFSGGAIRNEGTVHLNLKILLAKDLTEGEHFVSSVMSLFLRFGGSATLQAGTWHRPIWGHL